MPGPLKGSRTDTDDNIATNTPFQVQVPKASGAGGQKQPKPYSEPIKAIDASYANIIQRVTGHVDWFVDALTQIGWSAMLIAFQCADQLERGIIG